MAAVFLGARHLRQGIGVSARSIHIPAFTPRPNPPTHRIFADTRTFLSRLVSHLLTPGLTHPVSAQPALVRPIHSQTINARFSLPVKHALSRPLSPPRLPKPPIVPANVYQVGLGTSRSFHSGRPIFQSMVDNVPIATRALWEAEWEVKMKKKDVRRMRRATQNNTVSKSQEMLKPNPKPVIAEPQCDPSEVDVYFPVHPTPDVTTHLLVPLAPTPTARLPLSARTNGGDAHPLLPIVDLAAVHTSHRLHSLRVSTLFARLDAEKVWDDPGVNVAAYAFGPRHDTQGAQEKQCTVLRVTFRGWHASRVRSILGHSAEEWYSVEETHPDGHPTFVPLPDLRQHVSMNAHSQLESSETDSSCTSEVEMDDVCDVMSPLPIPASASAQHELVIPTLDFSSAFSDAVDNLPPPPQPMMFLRTVSELTRDAELVSQCSSSVLMDSESTSSWSVLA